MSNIIEMIEREQMTREVPHFPRATRWSCT